MSFNLALSQEKYYQILNSDGLSAALTAIHEDLKELEFECFEGPKGYQPDLYEEIKKLREFSRNLWNIPNSFESPVLNSKH